MALSFLWLTPLNPHGAQFFAMFLLWLYQFFADLFTMSFDKVFWEGFLVIPILGALIIAMRSTYYKQRYLLLFCMTVLYLFTGYALGSSFKKEYFDIGFLGFIVPLIFFIASSILLLYLNFKKPQNEVT